MSNRSHRYDVELLWTGAGTTGTTSYTAYSRDYTVHVDGRPELLGSADRVFHGDPSRVNPEELLVASLSSCHLLWYLHLCADAGIVVAGYRDSASGILELDRERGGRFSEVVLRPDVRIREGDPQLALALHGEAHRKCFIANSVNFPVRHEPRITVVEPASKNARRGSESSRDA